MANKFLRKKPNRLLTGRNNYFDGGGEIDFNSTANQIMTLLNGIMGGNIGGNNAFGMNQQDFSNISNSIGGIATAAQMLKANSEDMHKMERSVRSSIYNSMATTGGVGENLNSAINAFNNMKPLNAVRKSDFSTSNMGASRNRAKRIAGRLNNIIGNVNNFNNITATTRVNNAMATQFNNQLANYAAQGGLLNNNHGGYFSNGLQFINSGGTHEQNPYEGVPVGIDPEGTPNLVEQGEVIFNDYVFSNRLTVPKSLRKKYKFGGKKKSVSFADFAEYLGRESEERTNDPISLNGLMAFMGDLSNVQEQLRAEDQERQFAFGGNLFGDGGPEQKGNRPSTKGTALSSMSTRSNKARNQIRYLLSILPNLSEEEQQAIYSKFQGLKEGRVYPDTLRYFKEDIADEFIADLMKDYDANTYYQGNLTDANEEGSTENIDKDTPITIMDRKTADELAKQEALKAEQQAIQEKTGDTVDETPTPKYSGKGLEPGSSKINKNSSLASSSVLADDDDFRKAYSDYFDKDGNPFISALYDANSPYRKTLDELAYYLDNEDPENTLQFRKEAADWINNFNKDNPNFSKIDADKITGDNLRTYGLDKSIGGWHRLVRKMQEEGKIPTYTDIYQGMEYDKDGNTTLTPFDDESGLAYYENAGPDGKTWKARMKDLGWLFDNTNMGIDEDGNYIRTHTYKRAKKDKDGNYEYPTNGPINILLKFPDGRSITMTKDEFLKQNQYKLSQFSTTPKVLSDGTEVYEFDDTNENTPYDLVDKLEYAPVVGSLLGLGLSAFSKPDQTGIEGILEAISQPGVYQPVKADTLGQKMKAPIFNLDYLTTQANAENAAARRQLMNQSYGNIGAGMAGTLAADYNALNNLGQQRLNAFNTNFANFKDALTFNRDTDSTNITNKLNADQSNQKTLMDLNNWRLNGRLEAEKARLQSLDNWYATIGDNLGDVFTNLGNVGKQRTAINQYNWNVEHQGDPGTMYDPNNPDPNYHTGMTKVKGRKGAKGGRLNRRKKGLTI